LDESVPRRLAPLIAGHDVTTVADRGWAGMRNGELLAHASSEFEVLVTVDKNLPMQQDLARHAVSVVILDARSNRLDDLAPLVPQLVDTLDGVRQPLVVIRANQATETAE
jgi:hypothetical protein